jgi:hypothetical protein
VAFTELPPQLPPPNQPLVDLRTGLMNVHWYNFLSDLLRYLARMGAAI